MGNYAFVNETASEAIKRLKKNVETLKQLVTKVETELHYITTALIDLKNNRNSNSTLQEAFVWAIHRLGERHKQILADEARAAITLTKEFDYPPLSDGLFKAISRDETYEFYIVSSYIVGIEIRLDFTAGRLSDYANAVTLARTALLTGRPKWRNFFADPEMASHFWQEKIYRPFREGVGEEKYADRYPNTIAIRKSYFNSLAPWWQLLDQGNPPGSLASDRGGGTPYPSFGATNFVDNARFRIRQIVSQEYVDAKWEITNSFDRLIDKLLTKSNALEEYLKSLTGKIEGPDITFQQAVKETINLIENKISKFAYDKRKVEELAKRIVLGEVTAGRQRVGGGARIRITMLAKQIQIKYGIK